MTDDRYDHVLFRGVVVDKWTRQSLLACEAALGYQLTLLQGSFRPATRYSAGTHTGGGAVDLAPADWARKVKVLRQHGFAAWHRTPIPSLWAEHVHAIQFGNARLSRDARAQIADYVAGRDGLADRGPDNGPRIPLREFPYDPRRFDDVDEATLRQIIAQECDKAVAKYVGDVVGYPTATDPKNTIWSAHALALLLKKTGA